MRKKRLFDAMERVEAATGGWPIKDEYWVARASFHTELALIEITRTRWESRKKARAARTPVGHNHRDWV